MRTIEKLCKTDLRFLWLLQETPAPSFMTINNFMNNDLNTSIEAIFTQINAYLFEQKNVDLNHVYCPGGKKFHYLRRSPIKGNRYGRCEEYYQCEDCTGCAQKKQCCKCQGNRVIRLNEERSSFHQEVLCNLNNIHGALLGMNRSIQEEGVYGGIKWNRSYTRARRKGVEGVIFEIALISCGFNLHKYHIKKSAGRIAA